MFLNWTEIKSVSPFSWEESTHDFTGKVTTGFPLSSPIAYEGKAAESVHGRRSLTLHIRETDLPKRGALWSPFSLLSHCTHNESADPKCPSVVMNSSDTTGSKLTGEKKSLWWHQNDVWPHCHEVPLPIRLEKRFFLEVLCSCKNFELTFMAKTRLHHSLWLLLLVTIYYLLSVPPAKQRHYSWCDFWPKSPVFNKVNYLCVHNLCSPSKVL